MNKYYSLLFAVFTTFSLAAQYEASHWHLSNGISMVFDPDGSGPVFGGPSSMVTLEATTSAADACGNLLFYTNGGELPPLQNGQPSGESGRIWNRNHQVMYNMEGEEGGGSSSAQGALTFPVPGSDNLHYLFTVDDTESLSDETDTYRGLSYFIIDMDLNGGLGEVTEYNELFYATPMENLTATPMSNGNGYWLVTVDHLGQGLVVFSVTDAGISLPSFYQVQNPSLSWVAKFSPDGTKLVTGGIIYNFNPATGVLDQNPLAVLPEYFDFSYSFTLDSRYLYTSNGNVNDGISPDALVRYDTEAANVAASQEAIATLLPGDFLFKTFSIQLGPDGSIYYIELPEFNGTFNVPTRINRIVNPSAQNPIVDLAIFTGPAGESLSTFPNFVDAVFLGELAVPDPQLPPMQGDVFVCDNQERYSVVVPPNFRITTWTVFSGAFWFVSDSPNEPNSLNFNFPGDGVYDICVGGVNTCGDFSRVCLEVTVLSEAIRVTIDTTICAGDTLVVEDDFITTAGDYVYTSSLGEGCTVDTVYRVTLDLTLLSERNLLICAGDTLVVDGVPLFATGIYDVAVPRPGLCDAFRRVRITVVECNLQANEVFTDVSCTDAADASIRFEMTGGSPPFTYRLTDLDGVVISLGTITATNQEITENGLSPGSYQVTIRDDLNNDARILNFVATNPPPLAYTDQVATYGQANVSCTGASDGSIEIFPDGGTAPYSVQWADGASGPVREQLAAGDYSFTLTDAGGCQQIGNLLLDEQAPVVAVANGINAQDCDASGGAISVELLSGGNAPYTYRLNDAEFSTMAFFDGLPDGNYAIDVRDAFGCLFTTEAEIIGPVFPSLTLAETDYRVDLGDPIRVEYVTEIANLIMLESLSTISILDSSFNALTLLPIRSGPISITATSLSGCTVTETIRVNVIPRREVYAPNAFTPNFDGVNDRFELFAGPSVTAIADLRIFDRWGGLRYTQTGNAPAWDGGEAETGTYVWTATVTYLDGVSEVLSGSVNLLRGGQ